MPDINEQIAAAPNSYVMRRRVLRELAHRTEQTLAERERVLGADACPDRLATIVAVLDEASAYWHLQINPRAPLPPSLEEYQEIAADTVRLIGEQIGSLIVATLPAHVRDRLRAEVIADMRGPGDED